MLRQRKILFAKITCVLAVVPALIQAYEFGPPPGYTGAPGDNRTACISAGCHTGTVNSNGGDVKIILPGDNTYTPGVKQHIKVTITDSAEKSWGFQFTARLASNLTTGQAGTLSPSDASTFAQCADGNAPPCKPGLDPQWIEHTLAGNNKSTGNAGSYTYEFDWTPPATDQGNVMLYAAANASDGSRNQSRGHIYTATPLLLTPAAGGGATAPQITTVQNGGSHATSGYAPSTYLEIKGTNLAAGTRLWADADFANGTQLPTSLDGTSVTVNGKAAYVEYISPGQINVITPAGTATGSGIPVVVTTNGQASSASTITMQAVAPAFFAFAPGTADDNKYPAAAHLSGAFLGKSGLFPTAPTLTTPAQPGEIITLYGTGFGPTSPAIADGIKTDSNRYILSPGPTFTIGGISVDSTVQGSFAGLAPGFGQVYQFNIKVPDGAPDGDLPLVATVGGVQTQSLSITVKK